MTDNQEQIDYWNGKAGETWATAQERIDRSLAELSDQALTAAGVAAEESVLDIGCGCGTTTIALGSSGAAVAGIDISAPMLALARSRAVGLPNVSFEQADASTAVFEPSRDLVFSRFGVMFFRDPVAAFRNIREALKPDGRMTFLCWQAPSLNPWMSTAGRLVQPFLAASNPDATAPDPRAPGPFAFAEESYLLSILQDSGFSAIKLNVARAQMKLGNTVDEAIESQSQVGPLSRALSELSGEPREQALAAVREEFARIMGAEGLVLGASAWLVSARR